MLQSPTRRSLLLSVASATITSACTSWPDDTHAFAATQNQLSSLEAATGGRLGVAAWNLANGVMVSHRADERFPFCSTFKLLAVSAILKRSEAERDLLQRRIVYTQKDVVKYSPITGEHTGHGMTVADLCAAALQHSDNTAANLLIRMLGGPAAVTRFARSIGDDRFRLDRWETALNSALPGDLHDTTTPAAMMRDLKRLALGNLLGAPEREKIVGWMRHCTTGAKRVRAGVPAGWSVANKSGTGDYGTTNDIAVIWPPAKPAIVLAVYFTQHEKEAPPHDDIVASATRIVIEAFR